MGRAVVPAGKRKFLSEENVVNWIVERHVHCGTGSRILLSFTHTPILGPFEAIRK